MSYWKCKGAEIKNDGLSLELSFNDEHGCSAITMELPAEEWKDILKYQAAYNEPYQRQAELHRQLVDYMMRAVEVERAKDKETKK